MQIDDKSTKPLIIAGSALLALLLLALLLLALAGWRFAGPRPPAIEALMMASALDEQYRPVRAVDQYGPLDRFYVSVALEGYRPDHPLSVRWYYGEALITETALLTGSAGAGYAGFELANEGPWPAGPYRVDLLWQGQVLKQAHFRVE